MENLVMETGCTLPVLWVHLLFLIDINTTTTTTTTTTTNNNNNNNSNNHNNHIC